jgi:uncharacterized protein
MTIRRVVFDTSTLVSAALRSDSIPYHALQGALRFCDLCASKETLDELQRVLMRRKFERYLPERARRQFAQMVANNARLFAVRDWAELGVAPACRDPLDNKFLSLAFDSEADAIVSSDEDLLVLHPWNEIRILRPADFLREAG